MIMITIMLQLLLLLTTIMIMTIIMMMLLLFFSLTLLLSLILVDDELNCWCELHLGSPSLVIQVEDEGRLGLISPI